MKSAVAVWNARVQASLLMEWMGAKNLVSIVDASYS